MDTANPDKTNGLHPPQPQPNQELPNNTIGALKGKVVLATGWAQGHLAGDIWRLCCHRIDHRSSCQGAQHTRQKQSGSYPRRLLQGGKIQKIFRGVRERTVHAHWNPFLSLE